MTAVENGLWIEPEGDPPTSTAEEARMAAAARGTWTLLFGLLLSSCGDSPSGLGDSGEYPDPGPGPHYSVAPIELDQLARVTPLGTNGKILPLGHTYWYTCDTEWLMPVDRPCLRERLPIRSPVDGTVFNVVHVADGDHEIESLPELRAGRQHLGDLLQGLEVAGHLLANTRTLDLHRHRPSVAHLRVVDLPEGRRRDGLGIEP